MQIHQQSASRFPPLRLLELQPLIMFILVEEHVQIYLALPYDAAPLPIQNLYKQRLPSSVYVKCDHLLPHGVLILADSNWFRLSSLPFHREYNNYLVGTGVPEVASLDNPRSKDAVEHNAILVDLLGGLDLLEACYYL